WRTATFWSRRTDSIGTSSRSGNWRSAMMGSTRWCIEVIPAESTKAGGSASALAAREEGFMSVLLTEKQQQLLAELEGLPEEYFPLLLQMIRTYRASVLLQPAADSFRRGWEEAQSGETLPADRLWEGIDVE